MSGVGKMRPIRASAVGHPEITIVVSPVRERPGRYTAGLEGDDRVPVASSRQPFLDSARKLIERGYDPEAVMVMRYAGSDTKSLRSKVGVAARLTVDEHNGTRFANWKPLSRSAGAPGIAPNKHAATTLASDAIERAANERSGRR